MYKYTKFSKSQYKYTILGENIIAVLKEKKLSQKKAARIMNIDVSSFYNWFIGRSLPNKICLEKLRSFGVKIPDELETYPTDKKKRYYSNTPLPLTRWNFKFDDKFTRRFISNKAEGYNGDDWKIKSGEPIKPSSIKQFIVNLIYTKNNKLISYIERFKTKDNDVVLSNIQKAIENDKALC